MDWGDAMLTARAEPGAPAGIRAGSRTVFAHEGKKKDGGLKARRPEGGGSNPVRRLS